MTAGWSAGTVGRADELAQTRAELAAAQRGRGSVVVITGEAGVGKSRLLTETAQQAATGGMAVLSGRAVQPIPRSMW